MGVIIRAMGRYKGSVVLCVFIKLLATFSEDVYSQLAELAWNEKTNRVHPVTGS